MRMAFRARAQGGVTPREVDRREAALRAAQAGDNPVKLLPPSWMADNGLDDEKLAEKAGATRATISRLRRRKQKPGDELAAKLYVLSAGAVTPNDFYDLPPLPEANAAETSEAA